MGSHGLLDYGSDYWNLPSSCLYLQNRRLLMLSKHDAYYEPEGYDNRSDEIEHRTYELMKTKEFNSYDASNIAEALSELDRNSAESLQEILDTRDFEKIGRKIWAMTYEYLEQHAKTKAENEIND